MDEGQVLESWKEISAFLGRDVRTCQRWEHEMALPIHRLDGSPRARVFAYKDELSAWLEQKLHDHDTAAVAAGAGAAPAKPLFRRLAHPLPLALFAFSSPVSYTPLRAHETDS